MHFFKKNVFFKKQGKSEGFDSCDRPSKLTQIGFKSPYDLEIWWMTPKNQALICVSFQIHQEIQTEDTVRKRAIWVKIDDFFSRVTFEFDVWPWKTIGHLFYSTSSFVHYFVAISDFKLEIQSGKAQFGSKSTIFRAVWPCNLMYDLEQGKSEGFDSCDRPSNLKLDSNRQFFRPCDREIWWMTSKNNRALLLYYIKLRASFQIHW